MVIESNNNQGSLSKNSTYRPKFYSEYSMGSLDFERFNYWIKEADMWNAKINAKLVPELAEIQGFFSALFVLFTNWKAIIALPQIQEEYMKLFEDAKKMKRTWERNVKMGIHVGDNVAIQLGDLLCHIHIKLMETKQIIGLGIAVKKNLSIQERIKKGVRGSKDDFSDLPEA